MFEWDSDKNSKNQIKHGVSFETICEVFYDTSMLSYNLDEVEEMRWKAIGSDSKGTVYVVIYTYRDDFIRIISGRKATRRERGFFEEKKQNI